MKKYILRIIYLIMIILISIVIFGFSNQDGEKSSNISKTIITKIADILNVDENIKGEFITKGEKIVRKLAHFTIYTLLGIFSFSFLRTFKINKAKQIIITITWGIFYASTDEVHQTFINGRNGNIIDVLIDTLGVIFGIIVVIIIIYILEKIRKNKNNTDKII